MQLVMSPSMLRSEAQRQLTETFIASLARYISHGRHSVALSQGIARSCVLTHAHKSPAWSAIPSTPDECFSYYFLVWPFVTGCNQYDPGFRCIYLGYAYIVLLLSFGDGLAGETDLQSLPGYGHTVTLRPLGPSSKWPGPMRKR